jgi:hypothetical protein
MVHINGADTGKQHPENPLYLEAFDNVVAPECRMQVKVYPCDREPKHEIVEIRSCPVERLEVCIEISRAAFHRPDKGPKTKPSIGR